MIIKKIERILSKIKLDKGSIHQINLSDNFINENFEFNTNTNRLSEEGIDRIFTFFKLIHNKGAKLETNKNDLWSHLTIESEHKYLINCILNKDKQTFLNLMDNVGKSKLIYGLLNFHDYKSLINSKKKKYKETEHFIDKLISLGEYKRLVKVYNPENGGGGWSIKHNDFDYENLISKIFNQKNIHIPSFKSPNFAYGFYSKSNFYTVKDFKNFYTSIRINEIMNNYPQINIINEVGGGLGHTAYYNSFLNKNYYNMFDLPNILVLQAYFLMLSLGEKYIHLAGEDKNENSKISLYPCWEIFNNKLKDGNLWVNQDSLPQIDKKLSTKYIEEISLSKNSFLLSINQESRNANTNGSIQYPVGEIINSRENWNLMYRSRDFLRKGFIEELYSINNK